MITKRTMIAHTDITDTGTSTIVYAAGLTFELYRSSGNRAFDVIFIMSGYVPISKIDTTASLRTFSPPRDHCRPSEMIKGFITEIRAKRWAGVE